MEICLVYVGYYVNMYANKILKILISRFGHGMLRKTRTKDMN